MDFTQEQITTILSDFSSKKENGYETILKIALESLMRAKRKEGSVHNIMHLYNLDL